ncbi:NAD(P)-binding protein [Acaromyces ingoldii]|uniref:NAD(P)-binding protein n=1 Tax=Acaromyces ingoldii TaxID=215250 RepID=A0A316YFH0_9BASI|nr:NAD(P)-binding protein [Acaromyces ingoldii]PWN88300.1 NAD(P)-binding protein [Acaromyces ingoldii]
MTAVTIDPSRSSLRRYHHANGAGSSSEAPYALVTGATGGMGEEWAYQLAEQGFNVIIQGRNRSKLESVRDTILERTSHARKVELLVCEATVFPNPTLTSTLTALLARPDIRLTIVINNLGVQSDGYPALDEISSEEMSGIILANTIFPAEVSRIALPHLKTHQPSLLVVITSLAAWVPTPYLSPYAGTKGFDVAFSKALYNEMRSEQQQVDVVCMAPGQVASNLYKGPITLMAPTSEDWVRSAIHSLRPGWLFTRPAPQITPYWPQYLGHLFQSLMPSIVGDSISISMVRAMRAEHLAKSK